LRKESQRVIQAFLAQHLVELSKDDASGGDTNDLMKRITGEEPMGLRDSPEKSERVFETGNAPKVIE
jgi:hypothetical protein